jgi:3-oxoadipate enol-lactonase
VDYVGLSVGGMIGEALAIRFGGTVSSLMLCESPPAALRNAREIWAPRMASARAANSLEPIADATMERWLTPDYRARNTNRWQQIRDTVAATTLEGYCGTVAALSNFDFTAELPKLRVPALVLYGEDDKASSHEENERLASLIPGGRFVAFPGVRLARLSRTLTGHPHQHAALEQPSRRAHDIGDRRRFARTLLEPDVDRA